MLAYRDRAHRDEVFAAFRESTGTRSLSLARPIGLRRPGPVDVNGHPWPVTDGETVWLPAGRHTISAGATNPAPRLLRLTADLEDASVHASGLAFTYLSRSRAIALVNVKPESVSINGEASEVPILKAPNHWALLLPRGQNHVLITTRGLLR